MDTNTPPRPTNFAPVRPNAPEALAQRAAFARSASALLAATLLLAALALASGCDKAKEKVDQASESAVGCSDEQLGHLDEPDLPNCSRLVSCCKFLKGDCGKVQLLTPPPEVVAACEANEAFMGKAIEGYQAIDGETCPELLTEDACADGIEKTRERYRDSVDGGDASNLAEGAPSCAAVVVDTLGELDAKLGDSAEFLPEACSLPMPTPASSAESADAAGGESADAK